MRDAFLKVKEQAMPGFVKKDSLLLARIEIEKFRTYDDPLERPDAARVRDDLRVCIVVNRDAHAVHRTGNQVIVGVKV